MKLLAVHLQSMNGLITCLLFFDLLTIFFPVGGSYAKIHRGGRVNRRRESNEKDHVGTVLVCASEVLQISLHSLQGQIFLIIFSK